MVKRMNNPPHITEDESEVMKLLWQKEPLTANEIIVKLTMNKGEFPFSYKMRNRRIFFF